MTPARTAAIVAGGVLVLWTLASALQTVVVPRATPIALTRVHFRGMRRLFSVLAGRSPTYEARDRVLALYAPASLVLLPGVWIVLVVVGFSAIFWGAGTDPLAEAIAVSGSSVLTLGFERPGGFGRDVLSFAEAAIGLGVLSLMISYLPTIYGAFRSREQLVATLESSAGSPPEPARLITLYAELGWLDRLDDELFVAWEQWFIEVEESHTSQGSLAFFRSPLPQRSWITAAGCILDTAAIRAAAIDRGSTAPAALLIRTGYLCLRRISAFYGLPYDPDPAPTDPIAVTREEFDEVCRRLRAAGVPLRDDEEQAWRDFAGWRVNYDLVLITLAALVDAPPAPWSSDRGPASRPRPSLRRRRT